MNTITELEKAIEENRKAGEELQRKFDEYKNRKEIKYDIYKNYGCIGFGIKSILVAIANNFCWMTLDGPQARLTDILRSGEDAIHYAIRNKYRIVVLEGSPEAVARFLLGDD